MLPHRPQPAGDGRTQVGDHLLVLLPQRQGAAQLGHVLRPVAAVQRLGDLGRRALAAAIAQLGQHLGVAFAGQLLAMRKQTALPPLPPKPRVRGRKPHDPAFDVRTALYYVLGLKEAYSRRSRPAEA